MYIVAVGNIVDGLSFHGPFNSVDEAYEWGNLNAKHQEYIIATLHAVETTGG